MAWDEFGVTETPVSVEESNRGLFGLDRAFMPTTGQYLSAAAGQAFDRTFGARAAENLAIQDQEFADELAGTTVRYESEDEYKKSPNYRKEIKYQEGMTEVRTEIYAREFDERRERARIIKAGDENGPWWYGPAGFGAGIVGSLPDPINLIPFGGGAISGARLAGMTAKQALARSARVGAIEGGVGNLVSSSYAAYDLNPKGENLTAQDVLVDTMFGAIAGPLFHGGGALVSRSSARASMRADMALVRESLPDDSPLRGQFDEYLAGMREGNAKAYADAADIAGPDLAMTLRQAATPEERMEVARAMEKALADIFDDVPVDASPIVEGSPSIAALRDKGIADKEASTPIEKGGGNSPPDGDSGATVSPMANEIDWRTEPNPETPVLPERAEMETASAEAAQASPDTVTPEEIQAAVIQQERGLLSAEEAEIRSVAEDRAYIDKIEDASLKTAECVSRLL